MKTNLEDTVSYNKLAGWGTGGWGGKGGCQGCLFRVGWALGHTGRKWSEYYCGNSFMKNSHFYLIESGNLSGNWSGNYKWEL